MGPHPIDASAPPILGAESAGMLMTPEEFDEVMEYDDGFRTMTVYRNSPQQSIEVIVTEQETYQTRMARG